MAKKNTYRAYGSVSKFFHWTIFLLVFIMVIHGFLLDDLPKLWKPLSYNIHKITGLSILILMLLRLVWALLNPKPKLPKGTSLSEIAAERLMHFGFYLVLLAMPIAGWVMASATNKAPKLFGYPLSLPVSHSKILANQAGDIHEILAYTIIVMVCLHVLAALKHHFVNKDDVLLRIIPKIKKFIR